MLWLHILFAIFAAFRLTTLFTSDAIWNPVRTRFRSVPWHCSLCMSVWAGCVGTLFLVVLPWLNWPLAMSWLFLAFQSTTALINALRGPDMTPEKVAAIRQQAVLDFLLTQRNASANDAAQMAGEMAVLKAELEDAKLSIAELEKVKAASDAGA